MADKLHGVLHFERRCRMIGTALRLPSANFQGGNSAFAVADFPVIVAVIELC
jgi:hypothetical protein